MTWIQSLTRFLWAGGEPPDSKTLLKLPVLTALVSKESYEGTRYQEIFDKLAKRSADQPKGYALSADTAVTQTAAGLRGPAAHHTPRASHDV